MHRRKLMAGIFLGAGLLLSLNTEKVMAAEESGLSELTGSSAFFGINGCEKEVKGSEEADCEVTDDKAESQEPTGDEKPAGEKPLESENTKNGENGDKSESEDEAETEKDRKSEKAPEREAGLEESRESGPDETEDRQGQESGEEVKTPEDEEWAESRGSGPEETEDKKEPESKDEAKDPEDTGEPDESRKSEPVQKTEDGQEPARKEEIKISESMEEKELSGCMEKHHLTPTGRRENTGAAPGRREAAGIPCYEMPSVRTVISRENSGTVSFKFRRERKRRLTGRGNDSAGDAVNQALRLIWAFGGGQAQTENRQGEDLGAEEAERACPDCIDQENFLNEECLPDTAGQENSEENTEAKAAQANLKCDGGLYSQEDLELIWAVTAQEDDTSYEGALAVIASAMNRARINYGGYGTTVYAQLTAPGQYCYSPEISDPSYWMSRLYGNVPEYVRQAVSACLDGGAVSHGYLNFRSSNRTGTYVPIGGNWYF